MNSTDHSDSSVNPTSPNENVQFLKWLFTRNPFYIFSAGLLLYAIYRLSIDPRMFATELGQLFFNFGSFQVYELLLVGTAIFLARREIGYDSALLVGLETLFVFVPFILISQALLIEGGVAALFCIAATALAMSRFAAIKQFFAKVNLPPRLLLLGAVLLLVNLGLPLLVRMLHKDTNIFVWEVTGGMFHRGAWLIALPMLLALGNLLPGKTREQGEYLVEKGYFPMAIFGFWTAVTGAHLYSIGYVYGLKWGIALLVPILWVIPWMVRNRVSDLGELDDQFQADLRNLLLVPGVVIPFISALAGDWSVFLAISILNTVIYAFLTFRGRSGMTFHLCLISIGMIVAALPQSVFAGFHPDMSRNVIVCLGAAGYLLVRAILSRNPKLGLLGGIVMAVGANFLFRKTGYSFDVGIQLGLFFVLVHSLRWVDVEHLGAKGARYLVAVLWVIHTALWLPRDGQTALLATVSFALAVIAVYLAVKMIFGSWGPRVVLCAALLVLVIKPVLLVQAHVKDAPTGILALVASFVLFGIGTIAALTKNRWNKNERSLRGATQINTTL